MSGDAYVFGDLRWPMPDAGLIAVWRAMSIDSSRWDDWDGFLEAVPRGTIGELVDQVEQGDTPSDAPFDFEVDEHGARLRARLGRTDAAWWQRLAIAWRNAADLGAGGEFVWVPGERDPGGRIAYRGVIGDFASHWAKLSGARLTELDSLPGRQEVDALVEARVIQIGAAHAAIPPAVPTARIKKAAKPRAATQPPAAKRAPAKKKAKPAARPRAAAKKKRKR